MPAAFAVIAEDVRQYAYRFYNDDGSLALANPFNLTTPENVGILVAPGGKFRLRIGVYSVPATSYRYLLEYRKNGGTWVAVEGSTEVQIVTSLQFADGDATAQRLSTPSGGIAFVAGIGIETVRNSTAASLSANRYIEHEWMLQLATAVANDQFEFRLVAMTSAWTGGSGYSAGLLPTYTQTPVVTASSSGGSASSGGGTRMAAPVNPSDLVWGVARLFGKSQNFDDVPFGELQGFNLKDSYSLKEAMGTSGLAAIGVGISERKLSGEAEWMKVRLRQWLQTKGGVLTSVASISDPASAPTLTAAAGSTAFTAGYVAVAYAYTTRYGSTKVSPVQAVSVTSGQQVNVTALTLPAGVTGVDWYVGEQIYTTSPLALAGTLRWHSANTGAAFSITALPAATAKTIPSASNIGSASTVYQAADNDEPTVFNMHCQNPSDGSGLEMYVYGCICPDLEVGVKLRDWTQPKAQINIYGSTSVVNGRIVYYELKAPGDQTVYWV